MGWWSGSPLLHRQIFSFSSIWISILVWFIGDIKFNPFLDIISHYLTFGAFAMNKVLCDVKRSKEIDYYNVGQQNYTCIDLSWIMIVQTQSRSSRCQRPFYITALTRGLISTVIINLLYNMRNNFAKVVEVGHSKAFGSPNNSCLYNKIRSYLSQRWNFEISIKKTHSLCWFCYMDSSRKWTKLQRWLLDHSKVATSRTGFFSNAYGEN